MPLIDVQADVARAVVAGTAGGRLRVHARHYEATLVRTIVDRFPATEWLLGSAFVTAAARAYVRAHPPDRPCLAEYGEQFPRFLEACDGAVGVPYLRDFAELEWRVGEVAVEVSMPPCGIEALTGAGDEALQHTTLALQPGVRYLAAHWPVDALLSLFLTDSAPDRLALSPAAVWLEVRGARGDVAFSRLTPGEFAFRQTLAQERPLAEALGNGAARDETFRPGHALAAVFAAGLVRGVA